MLFVFFFFEIMNKTVGRCNSRSALTVLTIIPHNPNSTKLEVRSGSVWDLQCKLVAGLVANNTE